MKPWRSLVTRRKFLTASAAALGTAGAVGIYAWRIEPHWVEVVHCDLPIVNLPSELAGRRLLQISDLHVGPGVDSDYLIAALQRAAKLKPALTVLTGDFITHRFAQHVDESARVLEHLRPGPLGCAAVLGNHDHGLGWSQFEIANLVRARLTDLGIQVLRNSARSFGGLNIAGLGDLWAKDCKPEQVLAQLDQDSAHLVLCHNPDGADLPGFADYQGWILSGHTHGGQCKPPFLPPPMLPVRNRRYTAGAFELGGGRNMYINRGLGHLLRVRFNARPELTCFRMTRDDTANSAAPAAQC